MLKVSNEWHRRLIDFALGKEYLRDLQYFSKLDTCSYRTAFFKSVAIILFMSLAAFTLAYTATIAVILRCLMFFTTDIPFFRGFDVADQIFYDASGSATLTFIFDFMQVMVMLLVPASIIVLLFLAGVSVFLDKCHKRKCYQRSKQSVVSALYKSWREKYCQKIELED